MPCSPVPIPGPFLPVWFYSFLEIHKHFYSLSKPDDALGGRNASLVCNLSHAYHFYDCAPPPRLPSYAGPPCAPGTTHDSFSQVCACGRRHTARVAHGLCLLYTGLHLRGVETSMTCSAREAAASSLIRRTWRIRSKWPRRDCSIEFGTTTGGDPACVSSSAIFERRLLRAASLDKLCDPCCMFLGEPRAK